MTSFSNIDRNHENEGITFFKSTILSKLGLKD